MSALTRTSAEHRKKLNSHVDGLPALADQIGKVPAADLAVGLSDVYDFLVENLIPHMEAVEASVYPELDRLLSDSGAMAPMAREHKEIRALIDELGRLRGRMHEAEPKGIDSIALRRVLYRLHALLKVHLAEEELYLPVLEHSVGPEEAVELARALDHGARIGL